MNNKIDDHKEKLIRNDTKNWKRNFNNLDLNSYDPLITNFKIFSHELFVPESIFNDRKKKCSEVERFKRREKKNGELINLSINREPSELAAIDFNQLRI
jgi:hypothetical protein